jgi:prepilin-type N-terminal cleavage/methylation domain-containing protein
VKEEQEMNREESGRGFTLVELLVVIVVIGILATVAVVKFGQARDEAFRSVLVSDLRNLVVSQEVYFASHGTYAADLADLDFNHSEQVTMTVVAGDTDGWSAWGAHVYRDPLRCAVFYGGAAAVAPATVERIVACEF